MTTINKEALIQKLQKSLEFRDKRIQGVKNTLAQMELEQAEEKQLLQELTDD